MPCFVQATPISDYDESMGHRHRSRDAGGKDLDSSMNVNAVRCEALFASPLQRSEDPTTTEVREAIQRAVRDFGSQGCAASVAQEFGDHPETAILRMRWAHQAVGKAFVAPAGQVVAAAGNRSPDHSPRVPAG
jgi:hypothetical protein